MVHAAISDLFFNYDNDTDCAIKNAKGQFVEYDMPKLRNQAEIFLSTLESVRPAVELPTVDDLIADLQRLSPAVRKRPIHIGGFDAWAEYQRPIVVEGIGPYVSLRISTIKS